MSTESSETTMPKATVQQHEIEAWLGDGWRPGQVAEIVKWIQQWEQSHADASEEEQAAAWEAIAAHIDFRLDLIESADNYQQARDLEAHRRMQVRAAVWVKCNIAGLSEAEAARITGMHRNTMHTWITE